VLNYRQTAVTYYVYIQCDSTVRHKMFITSCKETAGLANSRCTYFVHLFTHGVLYIKGVLDKLNHR